eukprot:4580195-Pleurochrysis_carterae.AAC.2
MVFPDVDRVNVAVVFGCKQYCSALLFASANCQHAPPFRSSCAFSGIRCIKQFAVLKRCQKGSFALSGLPMWRTCLPPDGMVTVTERSMSGNTQYVHIAHFHGKL